MAEREKRNIHTYINKDEKIIKYNEARTKGGKKKQLPGGLSLKLKLLQVKMGERERKKKA